MWVEIDRSCARLMEGSRICEIPRPAGENAGLRDDAHGGLWQVTTVFLVGAAGLEPATPGLEIPCSIRLSYAPIKLILHFIGRTCRDCMPPAD
jgi:hypothetical protein